MINSETVLQPADSNIMVDVLLLLLSLLAQLESLPERYSLPNANF